MRVPGSKEFATDWSRSLRPLSKLMGAIVRWTFTNGILHIRGRTGRTSSTGANMSLMTTNNGISRLYETFGNGGADTLERTLTPQQYERTWYRQNPPLPKAKWSQRNNNNYEQTGLLISLDHFAENSKLFLQNFYLKSKRSIEKPKNEGPAAYVFPADDPRSSAQAELLRLLQLQGCEIVQADAPFSAMVRKAK